MPDSAIRSLILPALGTLGCGFVAFVAIADVHQARKKYGVKNPSTEINESATEEDRQQWKRIYRQYMNLIEWTAISQPIFWVSALVTKDAYGVDSKAFKAVTYSSALYPIARLGYGKAYQKSAKARAPYFIVSSSLVLASLVIGTVAAVKIAKKEFSKK